MFYHLTGTVAELGQNLAVIDCCGVGFAVNTTLHTLAQLKTGEKAKLYIAESIGETNFDLYGFYSKAEKRCFEMLVSVSGIGPKAAMSILSYSTPETLALAIMNNDLKALTVAPGIGKKIAQRVVLELKDKVGGHDGALRTVRRDRRDDRADRPRLQQRGGRADPQADGSERPERGADH